MSGADCPIKAMETFPLCSGLPPPPPPRSARRGRGGAWAPGAVRDLPPPALPGGGGRSARADPLPGPRPARSVWRRPQAPRARGLGREAVLQTKDQSRPGPPAGGLALVLPLISLFTSTDRLLARSLTSFQCPRVKLRGVVSFCPMLGGRGKQKYTERLTKQTHEMQTRSRAVQNWRQTDSDGSGH